MARRSRDQSEMDRADGTMNHSTHDSDLTGGRGGAHARGRGGRHESRLALAEKAVHAAAQHQALVQGGFAVPEMPDLRMRSTGELLRLPLAPDEVALLVAEGSPSSEHLKPPTTSQPGWTSHPGDCVVNIPASRLDDFGEVWDNAVAAVVEEALGQLGHVRRSSGGGCLPSYALRCVQVCSCARVVAVRGCSCPMPHRCSCMSAVTVVCVCVGVWCAFAWRCCVCPRASCSGVGVFVRVAAAIAQVWPKGSCMPRRPWSSGSHATPKPRSSARASPVTPVYAAQLLVYLPSPHEGGNVGAYFLDVPTVAKPSVPSSNGFYYVAVEAGCDLLVEQITSGARVCAVYDIHSTCDSACSCFVHPTQRLRKYMQQQTDNRKVRVVRVFRCNNGAMLPCSR